LEDGHEPELQLWLRRITRPVVPQAELLVVDLLRGNGGRGPTPLLVAAAARGDDCDLQRQRDQARDGLRRHPGASSSNQWHRTCMSAAERRYSILTSISKIDC